MAEDESTEGEGGGLFAMPDFSPAMDGIKKAGAAAKGIGLGMIAQRAIAGYFSTKLEQMRPDQLQTVLNGGEMLADMVDEDNEVFREAVDLLSTFGMSREEAIDAVNRLLTPQLVAEMLREADKDAYNKVMTHSGGGRKWFINQTRYLKQKIIRMLRRS